MSYAVKEIFKTLQGEGAQTGRPAVFCRFAGCNLACAFCDTDFTGGDAFATTQSLVDAIEREWQGPAGHRFVVLTGGEPLLQVDGPLIGQLHARGFEIAVETNGTLDVADQSRIGGDEGGRMDLGDEASVRDDQTGHQRIPRTLCVCRLSCHCGWARQ